MQSDSHFSPGLSIKNVGSKSPSFFFALRCARTHWEKVGDALNPRRSETSSRILYVLLIRDCKMDHISSLSHIFPQF